MKTLLSLLFLLLTIPAFTQTCDAEFFFSTQLERAQGVATDGERFWVSEREGGFSTFRINIYDASGNYVQTLIDVPGSLDNSFFCVEVHADTLWVVWEQLGQLQKLNKNTGQLYDTFDLPSLNSNVDPNNTGITHDGTYLWNAEHNFLLQESYLYKMDPFDGTVLDTLFLDITWLFPLEVVNGKLLGLSIEEKVLYEIDIATGDTEFLINWCLDDPFGMTYEAQSNKWYGVDESTSGTGGVYEISGIDIPSSTFQQIHSHSLAIQTAPNPAFDHLQLELNAPLIVPGNLEIYNLSGQLVLTERIAPGTVLHNTDVSALAEGMYFLRMSVGKETVVKSVIIRR